jgi:hypothetical protein
MKRGGGRDAPGAAEKALRPARYFSAWRISGDSFGGTALRSNPDGKRNNSSIVTASIGS